MKRLDVAVLAIAGAKRAVEEAAYLHGRVGLPRPTAVRLPLTERCNYKCQYCFHWRQEKYRPELSLAEWKSIVSDLAGFIGKFPIQFLGGEPMIWPGFVELAQHCRSNKVRWGAITNGSTLNGKFVEGIVAAHPTNIDISVDGGASSVHDRARGVPGSFRHIEAGLKRLLEARRAAGQAFPVRLKTTVHKLNAHALSELVEWASQFPNVTVDFSPVRLSFSKERDELYIPLDEVPGLEERLIALVAMKARGAPIETSADKLLAIADHFRGKSVFHGYGECRVGLRTLEVASDGAARHCGLFPIGNLATHSIRDLWTSVERREQIERSLTCELAGGNECGTACTAHRSLKQEALRAALFLRNKTK